jgi:hypothetical protein
MPIKPQHCPFAPNPITHGKNNQAFNPTSDSPLLDNAGKKRIQQVVGSFLYYAQAVDLTILMALSDITPQQSAQIKNTKRRVNQFLDYMWVHPNAVIRYRASDMVLNVNSDASYLSSPCAQNHAGGYFFLGSLPFDGNPIKLNGAIHITCTILKLIAVFATEAKLGALFLNAQEAKVLRLTLAKLRHPQPPTPIHIDNANAPAQWRCNTSGFLTAKHRNTSNFTISPDKKTWATIPLNTTRPTNISMAAHIMFTQTSLQHFSRGPSSQAFGKGVLKSGDPYSKKSPLPRIGTIPHLPVSPSIPSHQILGQLQILNRISLPYSLSRRAPTE